MNKEKISDLCMIFLIIMVILFYPQRRAINAADDGYHGASANKTLPPVHTPVNEYPPGAIIIMAAYDFENSK